MRVGSLKGLVSKRRDRPYQAGRSKRWIKIKNRKHPAMERVMDAWRDARWGQASKVAALSSEAAHPVRATYPMRDHPYPRPDHAAAEASGRPDEPATVPPAAVWSIYRRGIGGSRLLKPETLSLDLGLVLPGALVSRLQIGIIKQFAARTIDVLKVAVDDPDLLGKTGRRHSQGSRNQNSSQHMRELLFPSWSTRHQ
jgi:hypothetical protein